MGDRVSGGDVIARLGLDRAYPPPIGQRQRRARPAPAVRTTSGPRPVDPGRRHVWVVGCPEVPGDREGLLVEWRRGPRGWSALIAVALDGTQGPAVLTLWVDAAHLRPAGERRR